MKTAWSRKCIFIVLTAMLPNMLTYAEDTDIYAISDDDAANNPNVLIIVDNSANWNANNQHWPDTETCTAQCKQGKAELNALRTVIGELGADVNVGLMMFTSGGTDGAYPRFHIRPMNDANKTAFQTMLGDPAGCVDSTNTVSQTANCIYQNFNKNESSGGEMTNSASTRYSAGLFTAYKYFGGFTSPDKATADEAGAPQSSTQFGPLRYTDGRKLGDPAAYVDEEMTTYDSPIGAGCSKNYIVFIGNGYPAQDNPAELLTGVGGDATQLSVPDFETINATSNTLLKTGSYADEASCLAAAQDEFGELYASYSCVNPVENTTSTVLAESSCGEYASVADCQSAASGLYPGYDSYSCSEASSCSGDVSFGLSACGQYDSVAACEAGAAVEFPGYDSYACALSGESCVATTDELETTNCGDFASAADCEAVASVHYTEYAQVSCTSAGNCSDDLGMTSCYVSAADCESGVLAANDGYNSVSCDNPASCDAVATTVCAANNAYNHQSDCNAAAPGLLGATYASYSCDRGSKCSEGKVWTISGMNQSYTATASGERWTVTGTNPAGDRYEMKGSGGGSTYTISGNTTATTWQVYGHDAVITAIPTGTYSDVSDNYADEWAKFLFQTDVHSAAGQQNIRTYTIDVFKDAQDADQTKLLMSMANQGGGKYFSATDENSLRNALRRIFSEIQSVNSVFASSSLPVSVNTQGTYLNQVFIGMFRPKGNADPRWAGNLKQYKFILDDATNELLLADKNGDPAISATTGFITTCADSTWTTDTGDYWSFGGSESQGNCSAETSDYPSPGSSSAYSDAPDGDVVEKGAVAQKLRGVQVSGGTLVTSTTRYEVCADGETPLNADCRRLLTCNQNTCTETPTLVEFSTANAGAGSSNPSLSTASLGVLDTTERDALINWVRGQDVLDENANTVINEVRPSVHGAVIHSQPAVIDYGGDTGVFAFYGADDGVFHAVDGGTTDGEGQEVWGFIAPETYGRLKRYKDNEPIVDFPTVNMALTPTPQPKSYFFDGSVGVFQNSETVWIYPTMRRGGRAVYAFDVSTPTEPLLKWRKGCFTNNTADDSQCSAGWSAIGQTWSKPQLTYLSGYVDDSGDLKPVLVFGGGYDTCEDVNSQTRCASTPRKGANIWFVDADSGDIIRLYSTNYSVPGDVFVQEDVNGKADYVYAGDSGGYVYRVNVGSYDGTEFTGWSDTAATDIDIAYLSEANHSRKFLFGPDVAEYADFNAVMLGSGDREHPLKTDYACGSYSLTTGDYVQNQFFMIKDDTSEYPETLISPSDLTDMTLDSSGSTAIGEYGWRFELQQCEQVVNKPLSIGGVVFFGTNQPANAAVDTCSTNLGNARGYSVSILDAEAPCENCSRYTNYEGGGMPPSPVAGVVNIAGTKVPFLLGGKKSTQDESCTGEGCSPLGGTKIDINPEGARFRMFWYVEQD